MADPDHLKKLQQGVDAWNAWRKREPLIIPDLSKADLSGWNLSGANLSGADLIWANLSRPDVSRADLLRGPDLSGANLSKADLSGANLSKAYLGGADLFLANLSRASLTGAMPYGALLIETDLRGADLTGSSVYGASVWHIKVNERTKQLNLIITAPGEPVVTVDYIKVAQFIYLLLNNQEIRDVIDTITSKAGPVHYCGPYRCQERTSGASGLLLRGNVISRKQSTPYFRQ